MQRRTDTTNRRYVGTRTKQALTYAVQLVVSQLSNGIGQAEAVQFAAKYHNVTCAAIEAELTKKGAAPSQSSIRNVN